MTRSPRPTKDQNAGVPASPSGHSPKGGAASSTASPAKPSVPNAVRMGRLEAWLHRRRLNRTMYRYGGIQWCPWCKQCAQDNNVSWNFEPSPENPLFDVLTCGVCGGTSEWLWGMGMHFRRALTHPAASGIETEGQDAQRLGAEHESPTAESGDAHTPGQSPPLSQGDE